MTFNEDTSFSFLYNVLFEAADNTTISQNTITHPELYCISSVCSPGQAQPHDPRGGPIGIKVTVVSVRQQLIMVLLFHHADLEHSQLDRGRRSAGLQGAHGLTVAQVGQILPVDAQQHITWERKREDAVVFWCDVWVVAQSVQRKRSPLLIRPSLDKQPCGWTLVTKIGSSPLLLPRPPATVMPRDSCGSFFTVMCFSLQVTHWDRSWEQSKHRLDFNTAKKKKKYTLFIVLLLNLSLDFDLIKSNFITK